MTESSARGFSQFVFLLPVATRELASQPHQLDAVKLAVLAGPLCPLPLQGGEPHLVLLHPIHSPLLHLLSPFFPAAMADTEPR